MLHLPLRPFLLISRWSIFSTKIKTTPTPVYGSIGIYVLILTSEMQRLIKCRKCLCPTFTFNGHWKAPNCTDNFSLNSKQRKITWNVFIFKLSPTHIRMWSLLRQDLTAWSKHPLCHHCLFSEKFKIVNREKYS